MILTRRLKLKYVVNGLQLMCSSDDVGGKYDSMVPQGIPHPQFHKPIKLQNNEKHI
jgi:hypothetical protein